MTIYLLNDLYNIYTGISNDRTVWKGGGGGADFFL